MVIFLISLLIFPNISQAKTSDVEWLAHNIYHEARGESTEGKLFVAIVTINRVESDDFPDTIQEVIKQPSQFSWYWDGKSDKPKELDTYKECLKMSKCIISLWKSKLLDNIIGQMGLYKVKWYHNETVRPDWIKNLEKVVKIGNHHFYRRYNG